MDRYIVSPVFLKNGSAAASLSENSLLGDGDAVSLAENYSNRGSDVLLIFDKSEGDEDHDRSLTLMRHMARISDAQMWGAGNIKRAEDVKKILYAGCRRAILNGSKASNLEMLEEVSKRFGREKIAVCIAPENDRGLTESERKNISEYAGSLIILADDGEGVTHTADHEDVPFSAQQLEEIADDEYLRSLPQTLIVVNGTAPENRVRQKDLDDADDNILPFPGLAGRGGDIIRDNITDSASAVADLSLAAWWLGRDEAEGYGSAVTQSPSSDIMEYKAALKDFGVNVNTFTPAYDWSAVKTGSGGLVPVVVQDYRNDEVLMVAYMNEQAWEKTVRTGLMTYWSRSRQELWTKGETSGHFQYLKELRIDCDNDTLLAKVAQVGAACHTGNRSCFYRTVLRKDTPQRNPMKVFEDVFAVIEDRNEHPKEGSYTNYLFDKGIDKILKKCGEEATEIVIAAKNPNPEEVKYEMADFLYHMMVLMSQRGITWDDIAQELANRE